MDHRHIVIFDGLCNLCNGAVKFIINGDPNGKFAFAPIQSSIGQELIDKYGAEMVGIDTWLLVKDGQCYERTDAALEITKDLTGYWYLFRVFKILPRPVRDFFYRLIGRNRYALFGKRDTCMIPTEDVCDRFLE